MMRFIFETKRLLPDGDGGHPGDPEAASRHDAALVVGLTNGRSSFSHLLKDHKFKALPGSDEDEPDPDENLTIRTAFFDDDEAQILYWVHANLHP